MKWLITIWLLYFAGNLFGRHSEDTRRNKDAYRTKQVQHKKDVRHAEDAHTKNTLHNKDTLHGKNAQRKKHTRRNEGIEHTEDRQPAKDNRQIKDTQRTENAQRKKHTRRNEGTKRTEDSQPAKDNRQIKDTQRTENARRKKHTRRNEGIKRTEDSQPAKDNRQIRDTHHTENAQRKKHTRRNEGIEHTEDLQPAKDKRLIKDNHRTENAQRKKHTQRNEGIKPKKDTQQLMDEERKKDHNPGEVTRPIEYGEIIKDAQRTEESQLSKNTQRNIDAHRTEETQLKKDTQWNIDAHRTQESQPKKDIQPTKDAYPKKETRHTQHARPKKDTHQKKNRKKNQQLTEYTQLKKHNQLTENTQPAEDIDNEDLQQSSLEDLSESEEAEPEDDYDTQQLLLFKYHPLNINGPPDAFNDFPLLDALLISNLLQYRKVMGNFISPYELQAVPGFTVNLIRKIFPYITITDNRFRPGTFLSKLKGGKQTLIIRPTLLAGKIEGLSDSASPSVRFTGSRPSLFIRYKYQYRHSLQFGFTAEKDAGEMFENKKLPWLFDFHSFHFYTTNAGLLKTIAVGDFTVNLGQGLIHWQSQAFKKSAGVLNIKRQGNILRPYQSAGEYNFLRGIAGTIHTRRVEGTLFASRRALSVNTDLNDRYGKVITSIITSGLHRSQSEIEDKNEATIITVGGNISMHFSSGHVGVNYVDHHYSLPLLKQDQPYNLFAIKSQKWSNQSIDYGFTVSNIHYFGELAVDCKQNIAALAGLIASLHSSFDASLLYRSIPARYQAVYGNAFTENTNPTNEKGMYFGVSFRPSYRWKIEAYADYFSFPWPRYRVDAPSRGHQYLAQVTWKPSKTTEVYSRIRNRLKPLNLGSDDELDYLSDRLSKNWRTQVSCKITRHILIRCRMEKSLFRKAPDDAYQHGYLLFSDVIYKPLVKPLSIGCRILHFDTDGYDNRIYAYENDLYLTSSIPPFSGKGFRYYVNMSTKARFKRLKNMELSLSVKIASTFFPDQTSIGSGPTTVHGNRKTDYRLQIFLARTS